MTNPVVTHMTNTLSIADLRDYALPAPVGLFPLSTGAWLFVAALLVALLGWAAWGILRWRSRAYRRAGLGLLSQLRKDVESLSGGGGAHHAGSVPEAAHGISVILKRVALVTYPREDVAALFGDAWVAFLRKTCHGAPLPAAAATLLSSGAPITCLNDEREQLFTFAALWIEKHQPAQPDPPAV
jgi:hypothetical protein